MNIYTKNGDNGTSSTLRNTRLPKSSPIFAVMGTLDELSACLGTAKACLSGEAAKIIDALQGDLVLFGGEIAGGKKFAGEAQIKSLENSIDLMMGACPPIDSFVKSGKTQAGAALHLARGIARRAEREIAAKKMTGGISKEAAAYANRLSDFLFAMAHWVDSTTASIGAVFPDTNTEHFAAGGNFCETALWICKTVLQKAAEQNIKVVCAACDSGGNPAALLRADGAYIASVDIAVNKAFTSVSLQMPTEALETLAAPGGSLYGIQHTNGGRIVIFAGGIPLIKNNKLIGGFGVSGGSAQQDKELAHYAESIFTQYIQRGD